MKVGDKIKMRNIRDKKIDDTLYEVIEIRETSVKLKHPTVAGYFVFAKKNIAEVVNEVDQKAIWYKGSSRAKAS